MFEFYPKFILVNKEATLNNPVGAFSVEIQGHPLTDMEKNKKLNRKRKESSDFSV